jgi:hypothetical protein
VLSCSIVIHTSRNSCHRFAGYQFPATGNRQTGNKY